MHRHDFWELIRLDTQNAFYYADARTYVLSEGDLLLIPPNIHHGCEHKEEFSDSVIRFSSCNLPEKPILIHDFDGNIGRLFKIIDKLYMEKEDYYNELIESFLNSILIYLQKSISIKVGYPFVYTFKDSLYKNLSNPDFDLSEEILKSGYNSDYFRRCFKKEFNKSPLEYLNCLRITRAKQLLVRDDFVSIESVALQCGFVDSHYFSTFFKKHEGTSPLQYRKMKLGEKKTEF